MDFLQPNGWSTSPVRYCPTCPRRLWRAGATLCTDCCTHQGQYAYESTRARNGVIQYRRRCADCGESNGVKASEITDPSLVPVVTDYTNDKNPCARCRNTLTEYHHFAPQAIFGGYEAECWPGAWLCRECHSIWHRQMRMARGYKLEPQRRLREAVYTDYQQYQRDIWPGSPLNYSLGDTA